MRNHNSKARISFFLLLGMLSTLFSCDGVIFSTIRDEVRLSNAKIGGIVQNIVRFKYKGEEHIFITNGKIYHRSVEEDVVNSKIPWTPFPAPAGYIYSLAADDGYLYALGVIIDEDDDGYNVPTSRVIYCRDSESDSWKQIGALAYNSPNTSIICTNSLNNRKAYFISGKKIYELSGEVIDFDSWKYAPSGFTSELRPNEDFDNEGESASSIVSCASLGGTTYFSAGRGMTSNADDSCIYYASGGTVSYYAGEEAKGSVSVSGDNILSLGVTSDYLLVGTDEGIQHTPLNDIVPSGGTADFLTNADSTLSSYYEVPAILVVDPSKPEYEGTIYASSVTSSSSASKKNMGLWSYYASTREWNRE